MVLAFPDWLLGTVEEFRSSPGTLVGPSLPLLFGSAGLVCNGRKVEIKPWGIAARKQDPSIPLLVLLPSALYCLVLMTLLFHGCPSTFSIVSAT